MYAFEYEVMLDRPGSRELEPFSTIVLSHRSDRHEAELQALQGAPTWVHNLERTLATPKVIGNHPQVQPTIVFYVNGKGERNFRCHVRHACVADLISNGDNTRTDLLTVTEGGKLVGTVWVEPKLVPK